MTSTTTPTARSDTTVRAELPDAGRGLRSWLTTLDHKRIGVMYLICILSAFFVAGIFAILVRTSS